MSMTISVIFLRLWSMVILTSSLHHHQTYKIIQKKKFPLLDLPPFGLAILHLSWDIKMLWVRCSGVVEVSSSERVREQETGSNLDVRDFILITAKMTQAKGLKKYIYIKTLSFQLWGRVNPQKTEPANSL